MRMAIILTLDGVEYLIDVGLSGRSPVGELIVLETIWRLCLGL